ncbi:MAG TPA: hypothetical protein VFT59_04355 [Candidatus Saccharimonadales bacterium]|nr:hypothetical protein [Candidatus Saccharimonadales bacterium]
MKVHNEAIRQSWRVNGENSETPELARRLLDTAECWADAMEPALDQGTAISAIAMAAFQRTVPPMLAPFLSHSNDYMVDYLHACWQYGPVLYDWYESNRPTQ